jgi:chaperone required for assembly of F1-ATPase
MAEWVAKRFWTQADITATDTGFEVRLDDRPVKTPAKAKLELPTLEMAQAAMTEWDAQVEKIDPLTMPITRGANAAIDKVRPQFAEVAALVAAYGESDLLCYRAESPEELVQRQADAWDPLLDWAASAFGAPLVITTGVVPVDQPATTIAALRDTVFDMSPFELTAISDLVALSGSLVIGLAAARDVLPIEDLWTRSRIDENWQIEKWGDDDEATAVASRKEQDFYQAKRFLCLARKNAN